MIGGETMPVTPRGVCRACRAAFVAAAGQGAQGVIHVHQPKMVPSHRNFGVLQKTLDHIRDFPRRIRALRHGTIARRITRFRMGGASRTPDVEPVFGAL